MKKKVAVVFGGRSVEHEVSVITGLQVIENIDKEKYDVIPIYINKEGKWLTGDALLDFENFKNDNLKGLKEIILTSIYNDNKIYLHPEKIGLFSKKLIDNIDVVFPALHGTNGEDGTLQGVFELLNIPYVGGSVLGSAVGMDKIMMKSVFKAYELPMVDYIWFFRRKWDENKEEIIKEAEEKLGYPVFVKPANLGSSIGISKATDREKLKEAVEIAIRYDRKIIIEKGVENPREINCAVLGYDDKIKTSVCEEPVGWQDLLSYEDKYIKSNSKSGKGDRRIIPADLKDNIKEEIESLAKKAFMAVDGRGVARIDFLVDKDENIYVNEINTLPGSISYYLWEPAGITFKDLINELIEIAMEVHREKNKNMYSYDVDLFKQIDIKKKSIKS
ncbi:D-alanine--D-alanine ligase family protein [Thermohalobacter berrensis]|uniref:D-alanine--D-alanine ligase n=1 Tax=Thermohalobacter berrensis TaxID=99594 RepID=A0A419SV74_9FIRM|nr:D-alanine--D-alanine ligase family protein [Thermohalobacter berrensis]RKD29121.1 D-alanine--D-alanine ligase [Thermohalobacter berrensis]